MGVFFVEKLMFLAVIMVWVLRGDGHPHTSKSTVTKWAVLVAGSKTFDNYRHQADVCHAYQVLKNGGLKDENIIVFMYDDIAYNPKNPIQGKIINKIGGRDVYKGVPKDYTGDQVTSKNFYNVLLGRKHDLTGGSGKVLNSGPNDHIFIYYSDHGGDRFLGMPTTDDDFVYAEELLKVLMHMHKHKSYSKMVIYVEACKSASMFENLLPTNLNIYVMTASNAIEFSWACYCIKFEMDTFCFGNRYSASWMEDSEAHDLRKETLHQQYKRVKARVANETEFDGGASHVTLLGSKMLGNNLVSDFMGSNRKRKRTAPQGPGMSSSVPNCDVKPYFSNGKKKRSPKSIGSKAHPH